AFAATETSPLSLHDALPILGYGTLFLLSATCHRGRRKTQLIPADRRGRQGHATPPTCERLTTSLLSWFDATAVWCNITKRGMSRTSRISGTEQTRNF